MSTADPSNQAISPRRIPKILLFVDFSFFTMAFFRSMNDSRTSKKPPLASGMGDRIKELRKARGWNQRDLAGRANVSPTRLSKYENGTHQVPLRALVSIARTLAVPVDALFPDTGDTPHEPQDAELLARLRRLMALGAEEKAVACSLLDTVLAMREIRQAWQTGGPPR
jgi:transcriptional regulator with XRE-family HTH domain